MKEKATEILEKACIKATPNRLLVMDALLAADHPVSLIELETDLQTLERSSVLRVLSLLLEHDVVHVMEDGRGVSKYEVCRGKEHCSVDDMHVHFYCECCDRTFCFEDNRIPRMNIPADFDIRSANFMLKGICPRCRSPKI